MRRTRNEQGGGQRCGLECEQVALSELLGLGLLVVHRAGPEQELHALRMEHDLQRQFALLRESMEEPPRRARS